MDRETAMTTAINTGIITHYCAAGGLAARIRNDLAAAGKDVGHLTLEDLAPVDEFHIRGSQATLELAARMELTAESHVLDVGSGLGGSARTISRAYGCRVTGIDLTPEFCDAANEISAWLGASDRTRFVQGDAADLPFETGSFDAAMTIHAGMNIARKDRVYAEIRRVLRPSTIFAVYDVLQAEGGDVLYPVPWARDASISHLATRDEMRRLLAGAGFEILATIDSTEASLAFFEEMTARLAKGAVPPVTFRTFLGDDFRAMARNQVRNLAEKRVRTLTYVCRA
jgi:SAM-dependent methyltransferase